MEVVRLFHPLFRWLAVLTEAGGLLWLLALFLASLAWVAWGMAIVARRLLMAAEQARPLARDPVPERIGSRARGPARLSESHPTQT